LMGEAFALLKKGGVDASQFHEVMTASLFPGVIFQNYGKMILAEAFEPASFPVTLGLKDVDLARDAAANLKVPMLFGEVLHEQYNEAIKRGMSEMDWSAVAKLVAIQAGL
jgi:3-hydroxyisobutyrate dehydrogenase-like beta-hydroxyacid dehydrogenase